MLYFLFLGNFHNGVHVIWFLEAVPKTYQAKREKATSASVEEMVHPNPLSIEVNIALW